MRKQKLLAVFVLIAMIVTMLPVKYIPGIDNSGEVQAATESELRAAFVAKAVEYLGYTRQNGKVSEIFKYYNNNSGLPYKDESVDWCAIFVSVVTMQTNNRDIIPVWPAAGTFAREYQTASQVVNSAFRKDGKWAGRWHDASSSYIPQAGDLVLYSNDNQNTYYHVGIVESFDVSTNTLWTIEGNITDNSTKINGVREIHYSKTSYSNRNVAGFASPNFASKTNGTQPFPGGAIYNYRSDFYCNMVNQYAWRNLEATSTGNVVQVTTNDGYSTRQIWRFILQSDDTYIIQNEYDGKVLEVAGGTAANGTNVQVATADGSRKQRWVLYSTPEGQFNIKTVLGNYVLSVASNNNLQLGNTVGNATVINTYVFGIHQTQTYVKPAKPGYTEITGSATSVISGGTLSFNWDAVAAVNNFDKRSYSFVVVDTTNEQQIASVDCGTKTSTTYTFGSNYVVGRKYKCMICVKNNNYPTYWSWSNVVYVTIASSSSKINISNATVSGISNATYTGSAITQPNLSVVYNNVRLIQGTDYTVTYSNNILAGTATVTITGKGGYTGTITKTFVISGPPTNTPRPTATNTPRPTATNTPRPTATSTPTSTPTCTATPSPTNTVTPTSTPSPTATSTPTVVPPTDTPTATPTEEPSTPTPAGPTLVPCNPELAGFVERLYTVALGRDSEIEGKNYWITALQNGATGAEAAHGFFFAPEVVNANLSNVEYVTRLYRTFMDREPDSAGLNFWINELMSGKSREEVFYGFINSTEWINICENCGINPGATTPVPSQRDAVIAFATRLYTTCLGRDGEAEGIEYWTDLLVSGTVTGTYAAHEFFFSGEFLDGNHNNVEFINRLYRTFMGREASSDELDYWVSALYNGGSREAIFNGFATSPEFADLCRAAGIAP